MKDPVAIRAGCDRLRLEPPVFGQTKLFSSTVKGWAVKGWAVTLPEWRYPVVCDVDSGEVAFDNYEGHARIRAELNTPIQTGENFYDARKMQRAFALGAYDYVMPDAGLIGGVTGWQQAASVAEVHDIPMSSHLYPEFSRHLLSVTPTAHWLEYVDWASPVLQQPVKVVDGLVQTPSTAGAGIEWNEEAVTRYLV